MYSIKTILVATDYSEFSASALDYALSLADVHQAQVHLLHVVEGGHYPLLRPHGKKMKPGDAALRREMHKFVSENVDEYVYLQQEIRMGDPCGEIIRYAEEQNVDLIVIATHGRTGLAHVMVGSIAEKVVRLSPVPVLAVKPEAVLERLLAGGETAAAVSGQIPD